MLLDTDNEEEAEIYCHAMRQFKFIENSDSNLVKEDNDGDSDYYVEIMKEKRFNLLVDDIATGLSFRMGVAGLRLPGLTGQQPGGKGRTRTTPASVEGRGGGGILAPQIRTSTRRWRAPRA